MLLQPRRSRRPHASSAARAHVLAGCVSCVVGRAGSSSPRVVSEPSWRGPRRATATACTSCCARGSRRAAAPRPRSTSQRTRCSTSCTTTTQFAGAQGRAAHRAVDARRGREPRGRRRAARGRDLHDVAAGLLHARGATLSRHGARVRRARARTRTSRRRARPRTCARVTTARCAPGRKDAEAPSLALFIRYVWYREVLGRTLGPDRAPVLHCYGLHSGAMQYQPAGAPPPPSATYQVARDAAARRPRRRSTRGRAQGRELHARRRAPLLRARGRRRSTANATLDGVDQPGSSSQRACDAHMDLLKIALRLAPWCAPDDVADALACALEAARARRRRVARATRAFASRPCASRPYRVPRRARLRGRRRLMTRVRPVREVAAAAVATRSSRPRSAPSASRRGSGACR